MVCCTHNIVCICMIVRVCFRLYLCVMLSPVIDK